MNFAGKRVLVTGACGTIGSALVDYLLNQKAVVCAFDHNEDGLFLLEERLRKLHLDNFRVFLGDIRSRDRLNIALKGVDIVFHCAALKHVYLSEYNPLEAVETNINGVQNIVQAAIEQQVTKVIFTSSDKAVNPSSTMGATKLVGERLIISGNTYAGEKLPRFACVRFGNVLDSNGSVLQIFKRQLNEGSDLTITHPQMTRFFLTISQAVNLCLHAEKNMVGGEVFVSAMGAFDIVSLGQVMSSDNDLNFREIGMKPGEKLYEELVTEAEANRTFFQDEVYVILPDFLDALPGDIRQGYKKYQSHPGIQGAVRSDQNLLTKDEIKSFLVDNGILTWGKK